MCLSEEVNDAIRMATTTVEELTGIINGLIQVVKGQLTQSKLAQGATDKQIQDLTHAVSELTSSSSHVSTTDRPHTLWLPSEFTIFSGQIPERSGTFFGAVN